MADRNELQVKSRVKLAAEPEKVGTVLHVYSESWAHMWDQDVKVGWDGVGSTSERAADLEVVE